MKPFSYVAPTSVDGLLACSSSTASVRVHWRGEPISWCNYVRAGTTSTCSWISSTFRSSSR